MNIRRFSVAAASTAGVAAVLLLTGCSSEDSTAGGQHHDGAAASNSAGATQTADVNDADKMFAQMMIPHHKQAVEMSDLMLAKEGIDPRVTELARQIKAAQGPEIATMQGWLAQGGVSDDSSGHDMGTHDMSEMEGMLTDAQMNALREATGVEASRLFLDGMIEHHEGAVDMAEAELKDGANPEAKALAQQVITTQNAEIQTMRELLSSLK
ncbi:DUF305 domain-containing protein [Gordonia phosphorivorans]|uniref:DUF305 domain-containing protein n=1 Tax=Gordonia phosphorivorans TaxID=1056982 RepID=A0ABV6H7F5_9ACTN